jgi:hypothetical protein
MTNDLCPSLRFVEPSGSAFFRSMEGLWSRDAKLAARVDAVESAGRFQVAATRTGDVWGQSLAGDKPMALCSKYDPRAEAERFVAGQELKAEPAIFVFGFGLGYHVEQVLKQAGAGSRVWVFEPDVGLLKVAAESRDLSAVFGSPRVTFITHADRATLLKMFTPVAALIVSGLAVVEHPSSVQRETAFFDQVRTLVGELRGFCKTVVNTLVLNGAKTMENLAANLPWYVAGPGVDRLAGAFAGKPAIIVSAGPSLRKNKHLLRDAQGKAVIVAVQTTLKPLLEMGVEPQFVTSLDWSEVSTRFFEGLPADCKTELVAEPKATDRIFELHPGPLTLLGNDFADHLLGESRPTKARLRSGATVANLAFYLAEHLGCDPIIFVGQDLGFSDGLCYTPGTGYDDVWRCELSPFCTVETKQWEQIVRDRAILRRVSDFNGRPTYTEERLFTYLQQFERDFAMSKSTIIDATEGGVSKKGTRRMTLRRAIDEFCQSTFQVAPPAHPGFDWSSLARASDSVQVRREQADIVRSIAARTLPLLEQISQHLDDPRRVNRLIAEVDTLRLDMNQVGRAYDLIMQMSQRTELERLQRDVAIESVAEDEKLRQRKQIERDIENCRAVIAAADRFVALLQSTESRLASFAARETEAP